ncbi:MAG TPA: serine/threonine-protein kinase, partial [Polyangiaceae bacterium]
LLERGVGSDERQLARFMREARAAAAVRGANVAEVLDHGVDDGRAFIAMELLSGESLRTRIARTNGLAAVEALRFITDVLRAIEVVHDAGIVHRDLKPDNVFIVKGDPEVVKLLDFGIAKVERGELDATASVTQTGMMLGTPYYMSPEQAQAKEVDHRTDLWAIAVIAFEALTGKRPFHGDSFGELVISICTGPVPVPSSFTKVPRGFDEWFVRGTQRDRARRFQSAREMADELVRIATNITVPMGRIPSLVAPRPVPTPVVSVRPESGAVPGAAAPFVPTPANPLELTTGQHSAVSSGSSTRPREAPSAGLVALLALGALIVAAVGTFVLSGGAEAIRASEAARRAEASVPARPAAPPPLAPPPILPEPLARKPAPSAAPAASVPPRPTKPR